MFISLEILTHDMFYKYGNRYQFDHENNEVTKMEYINRTHAHVDCFKILFDKRKRTTTTQSFVQKKKNGKSETER